MSEVPNTALVKTLGEMKAKGFNYLKKITAVDYVDYLEVVYILYNISQHKEELVTAKLPIKNPQIESIVSLYGAADWYERELSEMFGIKIKGRKIQKLLLEKWDGDEFPLRKSFIWGNKNYKRQTE